MPRFDSPRPARGGGRGGHGQPGGGGARSMGDPYSERWANGILYIAGNLGEGGNIRGPVFTHEYSNEATLTTFTCSASSNHEMSTLNSTFCWY